MVHNTIIIQILLCGDNLSTLSKEELKVAKWIQNLTLDYSAFKLESYGTIRRVVYSTISMDLWSLSFSLDLYSREAFCGFSKITGYHPPLCHHCFEYYYYYCILQKSYYLLSVHSYHGFMHFVLNIVVKCNRGLYHTQFFQGVFLYVLLDRPICSPVTRSLLYKNISGSDFKVKKGISVGKPRKIMYNVQSGLL